VSHSLKGVVIYLKRAAAALLVALSAISIISLEGEPAPAGPTPRVVTVPLGAYRGLGTWVDLYDKHDLDHAWKTVEKAAAHGVRTIYLETANYHSEEAIMWPRRVTQLIHAAHASGIKVIAWYLPGFKNLKRDYRRTMKAIRLRTSKGQRFDGFAMDIESTQVQSIPRRNKRMFRLSRHVRSTVGDDYTLGAITPSPSDLSRGSYWGHEFPFRGVAALYDVILPMSYSSYRAEGLRETHDYIETSIEIIREESGKSVPIHVIGGVSEGSSGDEVRGFMRAVRENGILGGSYYDFGTMGPEDWGPVEQIPVNPLQKPVLPVGPSYTGTLGNVPGEDVTHPKEVFFRTAPTQGGLALSFEAFDVQARELKVLVNWKPVALVPEGPADGWGEVQTIALPNRYVRADKKNLISIQAKGNYPDWSTWGVREVSIVAP
jgi:hypothetical protein